MPGYCILVSDFKLKNTFHSDSKLVLPLPKYRNASALCGTAAAADLDFCARWPVRSLPGRPPRPSVPVPKSRSGGGGPPPPPSVSESRGLCRLPDRIRPSGPALLYQLFGPWFVTLRIRSLLVTCLGGRVVGARPFPQLPILHYSLSNYLTCIFKLVARAKRK